MDDVAKLREGRDLVSLLRDDEIGCCHECLCGEAADNIEHLRGAHDALRREIERLRAALKEVLKMSQDVSSEDGGELLEALCKRALEQSMTGKP